MEKKQQLRLDDTKKMAKAACVGRGKNKTSASIYFWMRSLKASQ